MEILEFDCFFQRSEKVAEPMCNETIVLHRTQFKWDRNSATNVGRDRCGTN